MSPALYTAGGVLLTTGTALRSSLSMRGLTRTATLKFSPPPPLEDTESFLLDATALLVAMMIIIVLFQPHPHT